MNEQDVVRILIPETTALSLIALLGNGITAEVCDDLGLDELYTSLTNELGRVDLDGHNNLITRFDRNVPVTATLRNRLPRYTSIDLT